MKYKSNYFTLAMLISYGLYSLICGGRLSSRGQANQIVVGFIHLRSGKSNYTTGYPTYDAYLATLQPIKSSCLPHFDMKKAQQFF